MSIPQKPRFNDGRVSRWGWDRPGRLSPRPIGVNLCDVSPRQSRKHMKFHTGRGYKPFPRSQAGLLGRGSAPAPGPYQGCRRDWRRPHRRHFRWLSHRSVEITPITLSREPPGLIFPNAVRRHNAQGDIILLCHHHGPARPIQPTTRKIESLKTVLRMLRLLRP